MAMTDIVTSSLGKHRKAPRRTFHVTSRTLNDQESGRRRRRASWSRSFWDPARLRCEDRVNTGILSVWTGTRLGAGRPQSQAGASGILHSIDGSREMTMAKRGFHLVAITVFGVLMPPLANPVHGQSGGASGEVIASNLGPVINSAARDAEPTFSADGRTMYFNCFDRGERVGSDICVSTLAEGEWTEPEIVGPPISTEEYLEVEPLLSPDGNRLYIMSNRPGGLGGMDIWVSERVEGEWTEPENLGAPINSPENDHCLYFAGPTWNVAYWTSTRPGGHGGNDIWMSERIDGIWQEAVNLGPNVNSAGSEHHSLPSPDGRSLYVSSDRPGGHGGEDIYVTTRGDDGLWSPLVNLGPGVNSAEHDRCPAFSPDFELFFFDSERAGGHGNKDLWSVPYARIEQIR
ncbi:MAG: hypothetical protein GEU90_03440 [Gemmatimonas sp.]|nr:hypothetical protein [Gemmatimonas sp.]